MARRVTLAQIMDDLRTQLEAQLADTRGGQPCTVFLAPGANVVADFCSCGSGGCGSAWVRLARAYGSTKNYPAADIVSNPCAVSVAVVLEVGTYRCQPTPNAQGAMSPVAITEATLVQTDDMIAQLRAIQCCDTINTHTPVLGQYSPILLASDCGGGTWEVTIKL